MSEVYPSLIDACVDAGLIPPPPRRSPPPIFESARDTGNAFLLLVRAYRRRCFICDRQGDECGHREPVVELALLLARRHAGAPTKTEAAQQLQVVRKPEGAHA